MGSRPGSRRSRGDAPVLGAVLTAGVLARRDLPPELDLVRPGPLGGPLPGRAGRQPDPDRAAPGRDPPVLHQQRSGERRLSSRRLRRPDDARPQCGARQLAGWRLPTHLLRGDEPVHPGHPGRVGHGDAKCQRRAGRAPGGWTGLAVASQAAVPATGDVRDLRSSLGPVHVQLHQPQWVGDAERGRAVVGRLRCLRGDRLAAAGHAGRGAGRSPDGLGRTGGCRPVLHPRSRAGARAAAHLSSGGNGRSRSPGSASSPSRQRSSSRPGMQP